MKTDIEKINSAWDEEGSLARLGMRGVGEKALQTALIPSGGDWRCVAPEGAVTRSVMWGSVEVALVNPNGTLGDYVEGEVAMGIRATPVMDKALRVIFILARDAENLDLIGRIARAAIEYVEAPAPAIHEPEEAEEE